MDKFDIPIKRNAAKKHAAEIAQHILEECEKQNLPLATVKLLSGALNSAIETGGGEMEKGDIAFFIITVCLIILSLAIATLKIMAYTKFVFA